MSAQKIHLVKGDTAPALTARLSNADGYQDLTGATVTMRLKPSTADPVLEITVDVDPDQTANKGKVSHEWELEETNEALSYIVEFVVIFSDGTQETFPVLANDVPSIVIRELKTA